MSKLELINGYTYLTDLIVIAGMAKPELAGKVHVVPNFNLDMDNVTSRIRSPQAPTVHLPIQE